jgi:DNA sulfur modification protein DndD
MQGVTVPACVEQTRSLLDKLIGTEERLARVDAELARVPEKDAVADVLATIQTIKSQIDAKAVELDALVVRQEAAQRRARELEESIQRVADRGLASQQAEDSRVRILKHSKKVRSTLDEFRIGVVKRHIATIEALVLDAFQSLLRKKRLIHALSIDPCSFEVVLWQKPGAALPIDRLSAGERQLLATALLWGLARAAGRPIPTIIDTPLGRLDSSHRGRLVETYFPAASHQVILLSTDEEIVGQYRETLSASIAREYSLTHDDAVGSTSITPGYFINHESSV